MFNFDPANLLPYPSFPVVIKPTNDFACSSSQVSYGSTSAILQNRKKYPLFYRTMPSDAACNKGLISLLKKFNWRQVGIIGKTDITHSQV